MTLQPNTQLQAGKYRIVRFISSGGFGCTYEAEHTMLHKRVAIKEFFPKDFCNRDSSTNQMVVGTLSKKALVDKLRGKFIDEAQAISQMKHQNIVSVSDIFEENGTAYYVMDFIDGQSLSDMLNVRGHLSENEAKKYILQVANALKYVHSLNRLHLDVKPANIMVDNEDKAILIDFGTSKQYDELDGENTSTIVGNTPGYAPIEQIGNDVVKFTPATDIYSLGATFYKLLTGNTPPSANLLASGEELPPIADTISNNVREAIRQALQINKNKRLQSIENFLGLLVENVNEETVLDSKNEPTTVFDINVQTALELCPENDVNLALSGDVKEQNAIGDILRDMKQYGVAFYWYQRAAEQGYAVAQYNVGLCFKYAHGVEKNLQGAFSWYLKSAEQGYAVAQNQVGACYEDGMGVKKNKEKAFFWYHRSAKQGNPDGQRELGRCYEYGIGVEKNEEKAFFWYHRSAEQGNPDGQRELGRCYEDGIGVEKNEEKAFFWYHRSAEQGDPDGQRELGRCYKHGIGVLKSYDEAKKWCRLAADNGDTEANGILQNWEIDNEVDVVALITFISFILSILSTVIRDNVSPDSVFYSVWNSVLAFSLFIFVVFFLGFIVSVVTKYKK